MDRRHRNPQMEQLESRALLNGDDIMKNAIGLGTLVRQATVSGEISFATDVDMFKVYLRSGAKVAFDIDTPTNGPPGLGSYLRLFNSEGTQLAANNDAVAPDDQKPTVDADGFDSYFHGTVGTGGWFYIGVSNWENRNYDPQTSDGDNVGTKHLTGPYQLIVSSEDNNNVLQITGTHATSSGFRGRIINGRFEPNGTDTLSRDQRAAQGALTAAEEIRHAGLLRAFLRGETNGNDLAGSPTAAEIRSIVNPIVSKFLAGPKDRDTLLHSPGSALSDLARASRSFRDFRDNLTAHIKQELNAQVSSGSVDFGALNLPAFFANSEHNISYAPHKVWIPFTLRAVIGGTQAIKVKLVMQSVTPAVKAEGGGSIQFRAQVRFDIFDVFGANGSDRYIAALESMWQLQHRGARARPFFNQIVINETISGTVTVPQQYNSTVVL